MTNEHFSMAVLGHPPERLRNGVQQAARRGLAQDVAADLAGVPVAEIPITSITNGVHLPTWVSHDMSHLYDRYLGPSGATTPPTIALGRRRRHPRCRALARRTNAAASACRLAAPRSSKPLTAAARGPRRDDRPRRGARPGAPRPSASPAASPPTSARTLLFRDLDRLRRIVNNPDRPVQFVFAGKAHPRDDGGKELIREIVAARPRPGVPPTAWSSSRTTTSNVARYLVQGVDVWLNTPRRPLEASGTSGMKAVANGALNMTVLDGWWVEGYAPGDGWAIGRGEEH